MSHRKKKLEQIASDLKTEGGKKLKSGQTTTTKNSNLAENKDNSASGSNMDLGNGEQCLRTLMFNISRELNRSIEGINDRILQVEENLDKNLAEKLTNVIHVTVKEEMSKARSDFDSDICAMKLKLSDMEKVLQDSSGSVNIGVSAQKPCSVIIRNLKASQNVSEGSNPIVKNKVISLVRDGMKLRDVRVSNAERKMPKGDNPGLVITTFESHGQVSKVLEAKQDLRKMNDYRSVYIEPYLSQSELSTQATFRTFLRETGKSDNYHVHGSKLMPRRRKSTGRRHGEDRSHVNDHMTGQTIRQQGGQPTVGGVNLTTARITMKAAGVTTEGRARTMGLIKDVFSHIEMTIVVKTVSVPIDR